MINGDGTVYVEGLDGIQKLDHLVHPEVAKEAAIHLARINGKNIGTDDPFVDTRLEDGSRIALVFPPCSVGAATISIRKFQKRYFDLKKLVEIGTMTHDQRLCLEGIVSARENVLIVGGTSTGKTSLLNAIANWIDPLHRVAVVEDTAEIQLKIPHVIRFEAKAGVASHSQIIKALLRFRPDRIIVGETRGPEAYDLLQALNTGHAGSLSTLHANSPASGLRRLASMALMGLPEVSYAAVQRDIQEAFQFVVHVVRDGGRRTVRSISRIGGFDLTRNEFELTPTGAV